jgi:tRNA(Arg) A34 adenosine deaminase TadA
MEKEASEFMNIALDLARDNMKNLNGGPFGAVIVKNGEIIAQGINRVLKENDPTCHAEIVAIRNACKKTGTYHLHGCVIYSSCEPCPMCLAAIYWARIDKLYYAAGKKDAARAGFADDHIYQEINRHPIERTIPSKQIMKKQAIEVFKGWNELNPDIIY